MIEFITIAIVGSVVAGVWDLFTTEVPDEVPALMIVSGVFLWYVRGGTTGDFSGLAVSVTVGTILLAVGLLMYKAGQWGGADAWVLAAIGYLLAPMNSNLFVLDFIMNFLIISVAYMIVYSIAIGAIHRFVFRHFAAELKQKYRLVFGVPVAYAAILIGIAYYYASSGVKFNPVPLAATALTVFFISIFWVYARSIEKHVFRRKISVDKLKEGDVLEEMLWRGITKEEISHIRKKYKFVTIKEGVRFVPVFPITLVATLLWGNVLTMLLL